MGFDISVVDPKLYQTIEDFCVKRLNACADMYESVRVGDYQRRAAYFLGRVSPVYEVTEWQPGEGRYFFTITSVIGPHRQVALVGGGGIELDNLTKDKKKAAESVEKFLEDVGVKGRWKGDPPQHEWNRFL